MHRRSSSYRDCGTDRLDRALRVPHGRLMRHRLAGAGAARRLCRAAQLLLGCAAAALAGCGGDVVTEPGGGGSAGGSSTSSTSTSTSTVGGCQAHTDCPPDNVCLFDSGLCAPACGVNGFETCGPGLVCDTCATSACPGCENCVGACLPVAPGQCDDHDDCPQGDVCLYGTGLCAPGCDGAMPSCPSPDLVCNPCATGSCPGCNDCVGACTESF